MKWAEVRAGRLGIELYSVCMSVSKATPPQTLHKTFIVDLVGGGDGGGGGCSGGGFDSYCHRPTCN